MFKGHEGKIIHTELHINSDCVIYFADIFNEDDKGTNSDLVMKMNSEDEINRVYSMLKEAGTVRFQLQKTFWGAYHDVVDDRYGNTWSLNYSIR